MRGDVSSLRHPAYEITYPIAFELIRLSSMFESNRGDQHPIGECVRNLDRALAARLASIEQSSDGFAPVASRAAELVEQLRL